MPAPRRYRAEHRPVTKGSVEGPSDEDRSDFLDWLQRAQTHYGRFTWDAGVVILLALASMILLALLDLSGDSWLLSPLALMLRRSLGWGSYLVVALLALAGFMLLRKRQHQDEHVRWGRVIALEGAALFGLAMLAIAGGMSIQNAAEEGSYGGTIGWALAVLVGKLTGGEELLRNGIVILGLLTSLVFVFDLLPKFESLLWKIGGEPAQPAPDDFKSIPTVSKADTAPNSAPPKPVPASKKQALPLPAQFRKNFKVPETQDEKPAEPLPRGERLPPLSLLIGDQSTRPV